MEYGSSNFDRHLSALLTRFLSPEIVINPIRYSINHGYQVVSAGHCYFCRIYRKNKENRESILAEHALLTHLKRCGVPVAAPLPFIDGTYLKAMEINDETYFVCLFDFIEKQSNLVEGWDLNYVKSWGNVLGKIHASAKKIRDSDEIARPHWHEIVWMRNFPFDAPVAEEDRELLRREWEDSHTFLNSLKLDNESYGLVHFDLHQGNLIQTRTGLIAIDFDDCCKHFFAWDFALPLHRLGEGHMGNKNQDLKREFIQSYKEVTPLPEIIEENLRTFERIRHTFMLAWLDYKRDEKFWREIFPRYLTTHLNFLRTASRLPL